MIKVMQVRWRQMQRRVRTIKSHPGEPWLSAGLVNPSNRIVNKSRGFIFFDDIEFLAVFIARP